MADDPNISSTVQQVIEEQRRREAAAATGTTQTQVVQEGDTTAVREVPVAVEGQPSTPTKELDPDGGQPGSEKPTSSPSASDTDTEEEQTAEDIEAEEQRAFRTAAEGEENASRVAETEEPKPKSTETPSIYTTVEEGNVSPAEVPSGQIAAARTRDFLERGRATKEAAEEDAPKVRRINDGTPDGTTVMDKPTGTIPAPNDVIHGRHMGMSASERGPLGNDGSHSPHDKTSGGSRQDLAVQQELVRLEGVGNTGPRRADGTPIPTRTI